MAERPTLETARLILQPLGEWHRAAYVDLASAEDAPQEVAASEAHWSVHGKGLTRSGDGMTVVWLECPDPMERVAHAPASVTQQ